MLSSKTRTLAQHFPDFYTAGDASVFIGWLDVFGQVLELAEIDLLRVMHAHWVDTANNEGSQGFDTAQKGDLDQIFSLYLENLGGTSQLKQLNRRTGKDGLDDDIPYRERIKGLILELMHGASTVEGIKSIVAANLGIVADKNASAEELATVTAARQMIRIVEFLPDSVNPLSISLPLFQDFTVNNPNPTPTTPQLRLSIVADQELGNVTVVRVTGGNIAVGYAGSVNHGDLLSFFADGTALLNGVTVPAVGTIPDAPPGASTWRVEALLQSTPPPQAMLPVGRFDISAFDTHLPDHTDPAVFVFDGPAVTLDLALSKLTPGYFTVYVPWDIPGFTEHFDALPDNPRNQIGYIVNKVKAAGVGAAIVYEKQFAEAHELSDALHGAGTRLPFPEEQGMDELNFDIGSVQVPYPGGIDQGLDDNFIVSGVFDLTGFDTLNTFA
jgi:hypothetical protein